MKHNLVLRTLLIILMMCAITINTFSETNSNDDVVPKLIPTVNSSKVQVQTGLYEQYNKVDIAKLNGKIILHFSAPWCPSCRTIANDIKANLSKIPTDVSILVVDYDTETKLKKKYRVTYQHTFVQIDNKGKQINKWSASTSLQALLKQVK